jgi:hypothetical protein
MPLSASFPPRRYEFDSCSGHVGFDSYRVAAAQIFWSVLPIGLQIFPSQMPLHFHVDDKIVVVLKYLSTWPWRRVGSGIIAKILFTSALYGIQRPETSCGRLNPQEIAIRTLWKGDWVGFKPFLYALDYRNAVAPEMNWTWFLGRPAHVLSVYRLSHRRWRRHYITKKFASFKIYKGVRMQFTLTHPNGLFPFGMRQRAVWEIGISGSLEQHTDRSF